MKVIFGLIICVALLLSCVACEKTGSAASQQEDNSSSSADSAVSDASSVIRINEIAYEQNPDDEAARLTAFSADLRNPEKVYSLWDNDADKLLEVLTSLSYSGAACKCLPEYELVTKSGESYGISISEQYARFNSGQSQLTEEQLDKLTDVILLLDATVVLRRYPYEKYKENYQFSGDNSVSSAVGGNSVCSNSEGYAG